jgi:hypothetical protein
VAFDIGRTVEELPLIGGVGAVHASGVALQIESGGGLSHARVHPVVGSKH